MKEIATIWKEFNQDQDKKEKFAEAERNDELSKFIEKALSITGYGASYIYQMHKMEYELKDMWIKNKHGIMERTLENALNWYNSK